MESQRTAERGAGHVQWCDGYTLDERAAFASPHDGTSDRAAERAVADWLAQSRLGTEERLQQRLRIAGLSRRAFATLLTEPLVAVHARLGEADWARTVERAFADRRACPLPLPASFTARADAGLLALVAPLVSSYARRLVDALAAEPQLAALLFATLPDELLELVTPTLLPELHRRRDAGELDGADGVARFASFVRQLGDRATALALLRRHPVLARLVMTRLELWLVNSIELARRLRTDWPAIVKTFGGAAADAGPITAIVGRLGDSHRGGRAVARVDLASGFRLVYKPRPLAIELHFQQLLSWINARGVSTPFRPLAMVARAEHGWVEHVEERPCRTPAELERFYRRQGGYLALLYLLQGCDIHYGNVIADGEHPLLIDLESLCTPERTGGDDASGVEWCFVNDSVLRSGLLESRAIGRNGLAGVDIGGLADPSGEPIPYPVPTIEAAGTDQMRLVQRPRTWSSAHNVPSFDGTGARAADHADAVEAGFREMHQLLRTHRGALAADDGPLIRFAHDELRVILQPTSLYSAFLIEARQPSRTRTALALDCLLDRLFLQPDDGERLARIAPASRRALVRGDIPVFTATADSRDLLAEGERIVDFFACSGLERVRERLALLDDRDCERQLDLIRAALATSRIRRGSDIEMPRFRVPQPAVAALGWTRCLEAAGEVAERLHALAWRRGSFAAWSGIIPDAAGRWRLAPAGSDLYTGAAGIALFLGYLGRVTGDARHRRLAEEAIATASRERALLPAELHGIGGAAGLVYALAHLSRCWDAPPLIARAESLARRIVAAIDRDTGSDVLSGLAGDVLAFAALAAAGSAEARALLAGAAGHLAERARAIAPRGSAHGGAVLGGFAHGAIGIAHALVRATQATGDARFVEAAARAVEYQRSLFAPDVGHWHDLRPPEARAAGSEVSWCHGTVGIGLARVAMAQQFGDDSWRADVRAAAGATLAHGFGRNHSLCHGDFGSIELLLVSGTALSDPTLTAAAHRQAVALHAAIESGALLAGTPWGLETPSLFTGLAGTGYGLLRIVEPHLVPSVLSLD